MYKQALNILLVDDQELTAHLLATQFVGEKDLVLHATQDPQQAIPLAEQLQPAVIILDLVMPGVDGVTLLQQFRNMESFADVPVIMLSMMEESHLKAQAFEAGATDYLIKLPDRVEMLARLRSHAKAYLNHLETQRIQRSLRESEQRFRIVTDAVPEAIIAMDMDGRITFWNHGAKKIFGYRKLEILGQSVMLLLPPRFHIQYLKDFDDLKHRRVTRMNADTIERVGITKHGVEFPLELSINFWLEGNQKYFVSVVRDITKRKQHEATIGKQSMQLLAMEKAASRAKSDFVANLSHEIRTPMNAIICLTDLALRVGGDPTIKDYLGKIENASHTLMGCLNDILDFSKIEAGKMDLYPVLFNPSEIFNKLADMFGGQASDRGIELVFVMPDDYFHTIFGDSKRLEQVLINLVRNAIKFTKQGTVVVRAHPHPRKIGPVTLHFSIEDTGIGIDPERIDKLFTPFTQADPSIVLQYGGTGLGLNICKQLVEMMGGRIWAESVLGSGSIFHFTVNFTYQSESNKILIVPECLQRIKILVVDDHELTREIMEEILRGFKFNTTSVDSGEAALDELLAAHASSAPYHLVFIDWRMAGMDGIETVRAIKQKFAALAPLPKLPKMIMLTAFGKNTIQQSARHSGIDLFLHKPITRVALFNAILEAFGERVTSDRHAEVAVLNEELEASMKIGGARVLLAEDNYINQQVARELLERIGVAVEVVGNGQEALQRLATDSFDAVLMDVQMPVMDGHTATRAIRANKQWDSLPIIAMTAHVLETARLESLEAGMNDHINKPIDIRRLYAVLVQWINPDGANLRFGRPPHGVTKPVYANGILPPHLPGIDIQNALQRLGGQEAFLKSMLLRFQDHANFSDRVQTAIQQNDLESARNLVHMMTGIAGNLSATRLQQAAHALELAIEQHRIHLEPFLFIEFNQAMQQVLISIEGLQPDMEKPKESPVPETMDLDQAAIVPILKELSNLLQMRDTDAELSLETLKNMMRRKNWPEEMQRLEERIQQMDYPGALTFLQKIQNSLTRTKEAVL